MSDDLPTYAAKSAPQPARVTSYGVVIDPKKALRNCEVGKSFVVDTERQRQRMIGFAKRLGIRIRTRQTMDQRFDVFRIE